MKNCIIFFFILFSFLILSSCTSILVFTTTALVTATWNDARTVGTQLDDKVLQLNICCILHQDERIKKFTRIISTVYHSHVLLTGQSPSVFLSKEAEKIVKKIHGVKNVYNAIRHDRPISFQNILVDILISNQIRFDLFIQRKVHISDVKIVVENREVFLLGQVSRKEGYYIEKLSKHKNGVRNVFPKFIYI